ncbi:alkaline phosphatase family protein [Geoalkalibacter halelectricus]|uniref:Alkaline phosphatase family protein n=1 Tax=Geoalkalibacter halelectricus TaxID=2847045 RepID=A0ABY5ZSQ4_9BACT|nr:alkaline phosphatase family protein [Geoalkalibacter halelectricus]MDO3379140.1 alkaline phosphatase family protein [Geoalkalibacter halelectricus]UWZ80900.1 alkaline phosphatase family protein [Geoalkalibacter halelectricus]
MPRKCVLILLDGLGDRSHPELGHLTPLQAAETPTLDRLATLGACGLYHAGAHGRALPSENAHFAMFGYGLEDFPGRGVLEALGAGVPVGPAEVAFLAHLVELRSAHDCLVLHKDRPHADSDQAAGLAAAVARYQQGGTLVRFVPTKGLFGVLLMQGGVSPYVTDTNTMIEGLPLPAVRPWQEYDQDQAACHTARVLSVYLSWAFRHLDGHPVNKARRHSGLGAINGLVTQRPGRLKPVVDFRSRNGLKGLSIASGIIYWGLASFLGMSVARVTDGEDAGRDLAERLIAAREALADFEFIHVHTKAPDEAAHAKSPERKVRAIEALDRGLADAIAPLLDDPEVLLAVSADHSTPSSGALIHSGEPVPLMFVGGGVRRDAVNRFDEISVASGALGCVRGTEFMNLVLNYLDRARLVGTRDAPADCGYWPGDYEPFRLQGTGKGVGDA